VFVTVASRNTKLQSRNLAEIWWKHFIYSKCGNFFKVIVYLSSSPKLNQSKNFPPDRYCLATSFLPVDFTLIFPILVKKTRGIDVVTVGIFFFIIYMFDNIDNVKEYFLEYSNTVDASGCPLCKRCFNTKRYIPTHILLHCPVADNTPLSPQLLSQLYNEINTTNHIRRSSRAVVRSPCLIWSQFAKFLSWEKDPSDGLIYEIQLRSGSVVRVRNVDLLRSRSGESLSKKAYRLRKRGLLRNRPSQPPMIPTIIGDQAPEMMDLPPQTPLPQIVSRPPTQLSNAPLFPVVSNPSLYPGSLDPRSLEWIISRITLTAARIKQLRSSINKWAESASGRSVGLLLQNGESFVIEVVRDSSSSSSHRRNTLQNVLVFLRTLITYESSEFIVAKANAFSKFVGIELRKLNFAIGKLRSQGASIDSQRLSGKWISPETITQVSKCAAEFISFMLNKFWKQDSRFPSLTRSSRSLFSSLTKEDARFYQACLLWRMFALWTPQRSGRIQSLSYGKNLLWDEDKQCYYFRESIDSQKSALIRSTELSTLQVPECLSKALDFNWYFVIPQLSNLPLKSAPTHSSMFLTSIGTPATTESVNNLLTLLVKSVSPTTPRVTCQLLRKLSQSFFFASTPTLEEIEKYNLLANHSLSTSLHYYKLFITNPSDAMKNIPKCHTTLWDC
jgi:hypothetical protein